MSSELESNIDAMQAIRHANWLSTWAKTKGRFIIMEYVIQLSRFESPNPCGMMMKAPFFYIKRRQITASCSTTFMKETWSWTGHVLSPVFMRGHCVPRESTNTNLDDVSHPPKHTTLYWNSEPLAPVLLLYMTIHPTITPDIAQQCIYDKKKRIPMCFTLLMLLLFHTDDTDAHHMLSCFQVVTEGFW